MQMFCETLVILLICDVLSYFLFFSSSFSKRVGLAQGSVKGQIMNILGFEGWLKTTQLCHCHMKAAKTVHRWMGMAAPQTLYLWASKVGFHAIFFITKISCFDFFNSLKIHRPFLACSSYENRQWDGSGPWAVVCSPCSSPLNWFYDL